ncbi:hypothetical protein BD410DRAFT_504607 [Rickenella mellea]|uniref:Uncharacterized protein n=1 Tax=Rickenella mellea TaxID=50990 RepID=A0A4Y7PTR7_9AGAM|nr:hypothetical protein BD410DRAFT_504607 [Rickenella mellea]
MKSVLPDQAYLPTHKDTVSTLRLLGFQSAFVGGVACRLFGNTRDPADIDIVVLDNSYSQESMKAMLVGQNDKFYLVRSKNPYATYRVLWYRLSSYRSCKVDLLQPGVMNIPTVDASRIKTIDGIPVMPFSVVLLLKLQAWSDHRVALKSYLRVKQHTDVADILRLLPIAKTRKVKPREDSWLPSSFITAAEGRVTSFVTNFPASGEGWKALGFDVPSARAPRALLASASAQYQTSLRVGISGRAPGPSSSISTTPRNPSSRSYGWTYRDPKPLMYDSD